MTVRQAIEEYKRRCKRGDDVLNGTLIGWLFRLDGRIHDEWLYAFEDCPQMWENDDKVNDMDAVLLVGGTYTDLYILWLIAQTDLMHGDTAQANNSLALFEEIYGEFRRAYSRAKKPVTRHMKNVWR